MLLPKEELGIIQDNKSHSSNIQNLISEILFWGDFVFKNQLVLEFFHNNFPFFWGGKDVCTTEKQVIKRGDLIDFKVKLNKSNFPDFEHFTINFYFLKLLRFSTRSCFAQSGVHIIGEPIYSISKEQINDLNKGEDIEINVKVLNIGGANIKIEKEEGLFRFYGINRVKNTVRGEKLYNLVKNGKLKIEGHYGKTWQMMDIYGNFLEENNIDKSERLILFLNGRKFYPYTEEQIIKVSSKADLGKILIPLEDIKNPDKYAFEIGETTDVELSNDIVGIIEEGGYDNSSKHITSPLIDPGFKGPIRTEIIGAKGGNNFIELMILEK